MATNIITSSNSLNGALVDTDANAVLVVKSNGYIVTSGSSGYAYQATGTLATATIEGTVISGSGTGVGIGGPDSRFTVAASGVVGGLYAGASFMASSISVVNAGLIYGKGTDPGSDTYVGASFSGFNCNLINSGTITGAIGISNSNALYIVNSGTIAGTGTFQTAIDSSSYLELANSGTIKGNISLFAGASVSNTGLIDGSIIKNVTANAAYIYNYGAVTGGIQGGTDGDIIANYGTVGYLTAGDGGDFVTNGGTVRGSVTLGFETTAPDGDHFTNTGIVLGGVDAGSGDDRIDNSGTIYGFIALGSGNDTYTGGDAADRVDGFTGNDTIDLGGGNDVYFADNADGKDIVDAGDGVDRYDASGATQAVTIDLGSMTTGGTVSADVISGFENLTGGAAADTLTGSDDANRIDGGMGADAIDGGAGDDRLIGGTGTDTITGGAGRDVMTGGQLSGGFDSDTFVFRTGDSGANAATRDRITDFTDHGSAAAPFATGADTIDLHLIDANTGTAGDQAFSFNATKGAAFSGSAGSLIWQQYANFALISGDTNGDGKADFTIQLNGTHTLFASDFVL